MSIIKNSLQTKVFPSLSSPKTYRLVRKKFEMKLKPFASMKYDLGSICNIEPQGVHILLKSSLYP